MADETIKTVREWARAAKRAQEAAGEEQMSDETLMRASLSWWMVCRDLEKVIVGDEVINAAASRLRLDDGLQRTLAILMIAANFHDVEPSTPHRAKIFGTPIDEARLG